MDVLQEVIQARDGDAQHFAQVVGDPIVEVDEVVAVEHVAEGVGVGVADLAGVADRAGHGKPPGR
jgi:hypothetical protein